METQVMTILYFYITLFTAYFIILALASLKQRKKIRDKYTPKDSNLCVVVYASGEVKTLENLIKQLKTQNYPKEHYTIYTILDKCINPPEIIFQSDIDINVINIDNLEPIGKSQAYSILAEKLGDVPNLDAFVFIDAKNYVDSDFLENINYYLTNYDVFMPMTNYIGNSEKMSFGDSVKATYFRYISKFIYSSRSKLGLTNLINTDSFIIKKEILNEIGSFDFRNKISEVNYTLKLAKEGIKTAFIEDVKIYTDIANYCSRTPSLSKRLGILLSNLTKCNNFLSFEYICSLAAPNWAVFLLVYAVLLWHTSFLPFIVSYTVIIISAILLALAFCISLFNAQIYAKEYLYLFAYPLYSLRHIIINFPPIRVVRNFITKKNRKHNIEKMLVDVIVTDGKNEHKCQIELISDDGLAKVKFINKNKTYTTKNNHLRMVDALKELSQKLDDYGLSLKTCQSCKYFQPVVDGSTNMVKGLCNRQFEGRIAGDIIPTLIWNTCPGYEKQNVVNLF